MFPMPASGQPPLPTSLFSRLSDMSEHKSKSRSAGQKPRGHRFGAHLSIAGGVHNAIIAAQKMRFDAVQVFVKNQRQWSAPPLSEDAVAAWHERLPRDDFGPPVAHATYLINLASADKSLWTRSQKAFADELQRSDTLAIPYLVVHPGAAGESPRDEALKRVARAIDQIYEDAPELRTMVLLETTAGQGTSLGNTFAELGAIIDAVAEPERIGVCIDSCHVFAAGYDIRDADALAAMVQEIDDTVGLDRVRCWHLNDSKNPLGSRVDRHEHIGQGCLGNVAFRNILAEPSFDGLPMILETPKGEDDRGRDYDKLNIQRLRRLAKKKGAG